MSLREFVDDSGADYTSWSFHFDVDGLFESAFGNYAFSSSTYNLIVHIGHYAWNLPNEYEVFAAIETYVNPEFSGSADHYFSNIPFTRNGFDFKDLWEEAPQVYFGGNINFNTKLYADDAGIITEEWLSSSMWGAIVAPTAGAHLMYAGSYSDEGSAFGLAGGYAAPWNGGIYEYSLPEVSVPDSGATFAMLGIGLVGLLALRRR